MQKKTERNTIKKDEININFVKRILLIDENHLQDSCDDLKKDSNSTIDQPIHQNKNKGKFC